MGSKKTKEIKSIFYLALAVITLISLITFNYNNHHYFTTHPEVKARNIAGFFGTYLALFLIFSIGKASYLISMFFIIKAISTITGESKKEYLRIFGILFLVLASSSGLSMLSPQDSVSRFNWGGITGLVLSDFLLKYLGIAGSIIFITTLLILSLIITTDFLVLPLFVWILKIFKQLIRYLPNMVAKIFRILFQKGIRKPVSRKADAGLYPSKEVRIQKTVLPIKEKITPKPEIKKVPSLSKTHTEESRKVQVKKPVAPLKIYKLPSLDLLRMPPPIEEREIKEDLKQNSQILEETLMDFGIEAKVVEVNKGPVITRYELQPASGVKVHKITSLSDNIALAMKAMSVRIVAPVPGKGTIGVEVPNSRSTFVYLREVLDSKEYRNNPSLLKLALGKDISGAPVIADLDDMPHLLIAGATGSGKTVCVNGIITTLLFNANPDELKFIMIDPKRVELAPFNNLPHLLAPVVTDPKKVSQTLEWVVGEMERRYELFAELVVRNIEAYNKKAKTEGIQPLPYIIIIIDELADLMLVAQQDIENMITRLAQLSRAVGIHMIIATQRPSVDVITGVIKANFPARISFKVASKVDSRTVIDINGAEKLLGKGDMLFMEPGNTRPVRAQGSLINDAEIERVTSFIKSQRKPEYEEQILKAEGKPKFKTFEKDEIYEEAVRLVCQTRQASVSMLQRRLGIGYTRAARLIDMMEDEGIVGPYQGSKPRDILIRDVTELGKKNKKTK